MKGEGYNSRMAMNSLFYIEKLRSFSLSLTPYIPSLIGKKTFESLPSWINDLRNDRGEDAVIVLVGNKTDKEEER